MYNKIKQITEYYIKITYNPIKYLNNFIYCSSQSKHMKTVPVKSSPLNLSFLNSTFSLYNPIRAFNELRLAALDLEKLRTNLRSYTFNVNLIYPRVRAHVSFILRLTLGAAVPLQVSPDREIDFAPAARSHTRKYKRRVCNRPEWRTLAFRSIRRRRERDRVWSEEFYMSVFEKWSLLVLNALDVSYEYLNFKQVILYYIV